MPIYERLHNGKKQWCYRCYYTDFNGDRVQKHSKWFNTRKEAVAAESAIQNIEAIHTGYKKSVSEYVVSA